MSSNSSSSTLELVAANASQPLLNVCISFAILETFFIVAFLFSWYFNKGCTNTSHAVLYFVVLGYIFCIAGTITGVLHITLGGAGYHANTVHPKIVRTMLRIMRAHEIIYALSIPFPKLAILCLYFRLFTSKACHHILYTTGFVILATCIFSFVSTFANCRPFAYYWDRRIQGHCTMNVMTVFRFYSIPNIVTDAVLLLLPIPALWGLHVGLWTKIGLFVTFLISSIGIVTSILRFVSILQINFLNDVTFLCVKTTAWTVIEPGAYFIAATMPTLRPLIRRIGEELDKSSPLTRAITAWTRRNFPSTEEDHVKTRRVLRKKPSKLSISAVEHRGPLNFSAHTARPSRTFPFRVNSDSPPYNFRDEMGMGIDTGLASPRSVDEESMLCAAAASHEKLNREGRNPDGTLRGWSLQPVHLSPLRASFYFA
ncbi:hypothetical protein BCR34DRAFT_568876 [Clohesyomyces aquaticus]|uniref:Rhodopsin domain-containing protein n=1 Tax=Clohesyomyces aquaticus TaxID=1231657 RepID=A0A1Y1ZFY0_9PLEO|nr:hypothetical protein BCR34DRAFT_568876 [Clohesyomyces aquaticus]